MAGVLSLDPALSLKAASSKVNQVMINNNFFPADFNKTGFNEKFMIAVGAGGGA